MREQLIQYVSLLFAGAPDSDDIKQEILQNTLDRYDDLVDQGKSPEAAYRLAISGIGDINEILGTPSPAAYQAEPVPKTIYQENEDTKYKLLRAIAIALYIICPIPLIVLGELGTHFMDTVGLCGTLSIIAAATVLIILSKKTKANTPREVKSDAPASPSRELRKSIKSIIWAVGLALYFILSFATNAWYITWVIFPLIASVQGLVIACMDLKEASDHEN